MKIDEQVESAVREAMAASVAGEPDRFDAALKAIARQGDSFVRSAVTLALGVSSVALLTVHGGERPDDEQLRYLATELADDSQDWTDGIDQAVTLEFLTALAEGRAADITSADLAELAFGAGGWLLSSFPDTGVWTDFLDRILHQLEATPDVTA
jgi:hypothetical protein